jgi:predicted nucleotidyltransferase
MPPRRPDSPLKPSLRDAVQAVARALSALPVAGMIIGGIAVITRGVPRLTRDVDVTIAGGRIELAALIDRLREHRLVPRIDDAAEFAGAHQVLLLRHEPSGVDVDLSIAWLPFELDALAAAQTLEVAGVRVPVARAEDLIVYKVVAFRPQDQQDIERLLVLHGHTVDLARIRRLAAEFAAALDEPDRLDGLEQIIRGAGLA